MLNDVRLIDANALKVRMFRSHEFNRDTGSFDLPVVPWHDIEDADTIDAVPVVHGRWEWKFQTYKIDNMTFSGTYPTCNLCGHAEIGVDKSTPYCPNCGAIMDGREVPEDGKA